MTKPVINNSKKMSNLKSLVDVFFPIGFEKESIYLHNKLT